MPDPDDPTASTVTDVVPATIGRYRVEQQLGRGGMGVVYLARDPKLDRRVAVKLLPAEGKSPERLQRFEREARTAAQLSHPNIATIHELGHELGQTQDTCFIVMEFVEGRSLRDLLAATRPLPLNDAVDIAIQIAEGLAEAHRHQIVHRDLKPHNVMITPPGRVKVLDFGLAKMLERDPPAEGATQLTEARAVLGTPGYMSPEQATGHPVDARSDVFSFGIVLYEMVTGEPPFRAANDAALATAIVRDMHTPAGNVRTGIPSELDTVIDRCMAKEPETRYASAVELLDDLRRAREALACERTDLPSIAVLPFTNMSADPESAYFTDGMAEEIITALSMIGALRVAARTSSFAFKGRQEDIRTIGRHLGVQCVLEGSVRKAGDRLRITAQLINVVDGYHLWTERYDRDLEDVFAVQDEIAQSIAQTLQVVLTDREKRSIEKVPTTDVRAYECYLRGRQLFYQFRQKGFEGARDLYRRAIELDPGYALAYAGIADSCSMLYTWYARDEADLREADTASRKALALDPELAAAHVARGLAISLQGDFESARPHFETAIRLDGQLYEAYYLFARACFAAGRIEEAARLYGEAWRVRPEDFVAPGLQALCYGALGREAEADDLTRRAIEIIEDRLKLNPGDTRAICFHANASAKLGDAEKAIELIQRAIAMDPGEFQVLHAAACVYALLGRTAEAVDLLERAVTSGYGFRDWFENDPDFDSIRDDPRYQAVLEKL